MEFPHLGQHCNEAACNRLDFLPMKCDACGGVFCSSHFNYARHSCPSAYKKDVQVPMCPLCGEPVPTAPGVEPDLTVGQHIDKQCKSDTKKIYTNRCNAKGCKRKELIPVTCTQCKLNFCLRHRHTADHDCKPILAAGTSSGASSSSGIQSIFKKITGNGGDDARSMAAKAAEYRRNNKPTTLFDVNPKPRQVLAAANQNAAVSQMQNIQGDMTEDEALARALALSIMELDEAADRNRRNETAAANNTTGQRGVSVGGQHSNDKDKCSLS